MKNLIKEMLDTCEELTVYVFLLQCVLDCAEKNNLLPDTVQSGLSRLMDRLHDISGELTEDTINISENTNLSLSEVLHHG